MRWHYACLCQGYLRKQRQLMNKEYTPWTGHWYSSKPSPVSSQSSVFIVFGKLRIGLFLTRDKNEHSYGCLYPFVLFEGWRYASSAVPVSWISPRGPKMKIFSVAFNYCRIIPLPFPVDVSDSSILQLSSKDKDTGGGKYDQQWQQTGDLHGLFLSSHESLIDHIE
jgi:hypothetical protein